MAILSFSQEHEAGATIVKNGRIVAAINEERLTRVKNQDGFPQRSIDAVLSLSGLLPKDIEHVIIPEISKVEDLFRNVVRYPFTLLDTAGVRWPKFVDILRHVLLSTFILLRTYSRVLIGHFLDERRLRRMFPDAKFHRVGHHVAHAASAYFTSGFPKAIIITADYWGDFSSTMVSIGEGKDIRVIANSYYPHSLGHYYASLTTWLGFRANRHEGKILGLAAFGDPNSPAYDRIRDLLVCRGFQIKAPFMIGKLWHKKLPFLKDCLMRQLMRDYSREDIAAVFQRRFEEVLTELVSNCVKAFGIENVVLAGGSFSNVKANQRIFEVPGVRQIFIFPNMTDGGLSSGAALYYDVNRNGSFSGTLSDVYFGPGFTDNEIEQALKAAGLRYQRYEDIESKVAALLAAGHVVARFHGKMEFGPRALGNRSILYQATDPTVNDWLNKKLQRTEFMPFAPVTLIEHAEACYKNLRGAEYPAKFMTITFDCTDYMRQTSPATVHVDGTARPQLVSREENPSYYRILEEYYKLTGIPSLINTSFNMHEEPIVCTPQDAIRAFQLGHLDYLAIGNYLVQNDEV